MARGRRVLACALACAGARARADVGGRLVVVPGRDLRARAVRGARPGRALDLRDPTPRASAFVTPPTGGGWPRARRPAPAPRARPGRRPRVRVRGRERAGVRARAGGSAGAQAVGACASARRVGRRVRRGVPRAGAHAQRDRRARRGLAVRRRRPRGRAGGAPAQRVGARGPLHARRALRELSACSPGLPRRLRRGRRVALRDRGVGVATVAARARGARAARPRAGA